MINPEDVLFLEECEYTVRQNKGWKLLLVANHYKYKFWYEIEDPEGCIYDFTTTDIYAAIDKFNELQAAANKGKEDEYE